MKKLKPYLYTGGIIFLILSIIFIIKGIFPFGSESLIWGDMHDQVTAFYYHLYDSVYGSKSLFVDFNIGAGVSFVGLIAYYLLSPFSLLILLVPRANVYQMVSVIVMLKFIACGITCLYFIRTYFKKIPSMLQVMLAILYAFSGYALLMYQITTWMDAMYMFPLLMIGLKKVLDLEKPTFYIVTLTLSLIFSFYVSVMSLIFIFFGSLVYILVFKDKNDRKKIIASLGLSTILSLLISSFVIVPAYLQIADSSRIGTNIEALLNSRLGPITDKVGMMLFGSIIYVEIILLLTKFKENKKFFKFYLPTLGIVLIPFVVEPINKVWHFGNYASFPYRFGYITAFLLILGACYYFENFKEEKIDLSRTKKIFITISTLVLSCLIIAIGYKYRVSIQEGVNALTLSKNSKLILILIGMFILSFIGTFIIIFKNKKLDRFTITLLFIMTLSHIFTTSYLYIGLDRYKVKLNNEYKLYIEESKDSIDTNGLRTITAVENRKDFVTNSALVNKMDNIDYFSSLTSRQSLEAFKKLGFSSYWVETLSSDSTQFMDAIVGNKYIISDSDKGFDNYNLIKIYDGTYIYENVNTISFGFLINKNDTIADKNNSFEVANILYRNILDTNEDIFTIEDDFELNNISSEKTKKGLTKYSIIDKNQEAYFSKIVKVEGLKNLYLELPTGNDNSGNYNVNKRYDLYINGELVKENAFNEPADGSYNLGLYEDTELDIKIVLKKSSTIRDIYLGSMDVEKYYDFLDKYYIDTKVSFNRNTMKVSVDSSEDKMLFLPINYSKDLTGYNNGKEVELVKLYDNFVGIRVSNGTNDITIKYTPNNLIKFSIISIISLIATIILLVTNFYNKIIENKIFNNLAYYVYLSLYVLSVFIIYVLGIIVFLASFIIHIRL